MDGIARTRLPFRYFLGALIGAVLVSLGIVSPTNAYTETFASSNANQNYVLYLPFEDYPRTSSNFPRGGSSWACDEFYKSSYVEAAYTATNDGNIFDVDGDCSPAWSDGGTNTVMVDPATGFNSGARGAWMYPSAYGGWTTDTTTPSMWSTTWRRANSLPFISGCVKDASSYKLDLDSSYPDAPVFNSFDQIWGSSCRDDEDKRYVWTDNNSAAPGCAFSNGSTLYRNIFTLTQDQIDTINLVGANVRLNFIADDWAIMYLNGRKITQTYNSADVYSTQSIPKHYFNLGTNVLSFQVIDKVQAKPSSSCPGSHARGSGIRYMLRLIVPDGYELAPVSTCYDSVGNVISSATDGEEITCRHRLPMTAGSFDSSTQPTAYRVDCSLVGGATVSGACSQPTTPPSGGTVYSRTDLNNTFEVVRTFIVGGPVGAQVCTNITATPGGRTNTGSLLGDRTSPQVCVTISGASSQPPLAYFLSGDVFANGNIRGATYTSGGITYGTHGDYAVIGNQQITDMGSKAGATSTALTFAAPAPLGNMNRIPLGPPSLNMLGTPFANSGVTLSSFTSGVYSKSGDVNTTNSTNIDQNLVLYIDGNLTIGGDITVNDTAVLPASQLPNIVIVASGNIVINENVERVDATLISHGTLKTCNVPKTNLSASVCDKKLTINGPVIAKNIALYRTNTSPTSAHLGAAETIVYRPSALIAPYLQPTSGALTTEIEYELPPRY